MDQTSNRCQQRSIDSCSLLLLDFQFIILDIQYKNHEIHTPNTLYIN